MRKFFLILSVFGFSLVSFANQGISYFKSGFPEVAKPILLSSFKSATTEKAKVAYYLGNAYFLENKLDSSAYYFEEGLKADPIYAFNAVGKLMLNIKSYNAKQLDAELKKILKVNKNKKNIDLMIAISNAFLYSNMLDNAMVYEEKAKSLNSKNADVYVLLGDILKAKSDDGSAAQNYETALHFNQKNIEAYIKYARLYKNANAKLAINKLEALKQLAPDFVLADRELGDVYYATNDFAKAISYYDTYLKSGNTNSVPDLVRFSMALFFNREFDKSLQIAQKALSIDSNSSAVLRLIMYNNVDLKQFDKAIEVAKQLLNTPDSKQITYLDHIYYAKALKETKQFDAAYAEFTTAYQVDNSKVEIWKDISDMFAEVNKYPQAIEAYKKFTELNKKAELSTELAVSLGKLYYRLGNDTTYTSVVRNQSLLSADSIFNTLSVNKPEDYRGNFWRARTNVALDPETTQGLAKPFYESTIQFVEAKKDVRYNNIAIECYSYLGWYYFTTKDYTSSLNYWNKIIALDPTNQVAIKGIQNIQAPKKGNKK